MVVNKRKKNSRMRGSWTHGWGEKKKHRGAGSRGGRGMAGSGKRADQKKPSISGDPKYFGKFGFVRHASGISKISAINLKVISSDIHTLVAAGIAKKDGSAYTLDFSKSAFNKLLGAGSVNGVYNITIESASASAIEKVKKAGGSVTVSKSSDE